MQTIGSPVDAEKCDICGVSRALTGEGRLFQMIIASPKKFYRRMLCENCIRIFNQNNWRSLVSALKFYGMTPWARRNR